MKHFPQGINWREWLTSHLFIKDVNSTLRIIGYCPGYYLFAAPDPLSILLQSALCPVWTVLGRPWFPGFWMDLGKGGTDRSSKGRRSQWLGYLFSYFAFLEDGALSWRPQLSGPSSSPTASIPLLIPLSPSAGDSSAVANLRALHHPCWFLLALPTPTNKLFIKVSSIALAGSSYHSLLVLIYCPQVEITMIWLCWLHLEGE